MIRNATIVEFANLIVAAEKSANEARSMSANMDKNGHGIMAESFAKLASNYDDDVCALCTKLQTYINTNGRSK